MNETNISYILQEQLTGVDMPESYELPWGFKISVLGMYICVILLSIGGNAIVCYVVFALQRLRTVTNFFIVSLSISDILVTTLCVPFTVLSNLIFHYWPFGPFMCPFVGYLQVVTVLQRSFTLVAMTVDRHYAIWKPLNRRIRKIEAKILIVIIWVVALFISLPSAIFSKIVFLPVEPGSWGLCIESWSDHKARHWYSIIIMLLQYFLPLAIMCITYIHISVIVWIKRPPGEADNDRDMRLAASKRKTVKMLIAVVVTYAASWLPLHVITLVGEVNPIIFNQQHIHVIWLLSHWLAMSNSCFNPIIYIWMNSKFRQGFIQVFYILSCRKNRYHPPIHGSRTSARSLSSNRGSMQASSENKPTALIATSRFD